MKLETIRKIIISICFLLLSGYIGFRLGEKQVVKTVISSPPMPSAVVVNQNPPTNREVDFALFWDVWTRLEQRFLEKKALDPEKMVYGAISGMVASLGDPYTVFLSPKENAGFKDDLNGKFEGIGAHLGSKDEKIIVISPLKGQPAEVAGIKPGDWIMKVNDEETIGWTVPQAVNKIRGPKNTEVILTIMHENEQTPVELKIIRDQITVKSVEFELKTSQSDACSQEKCPAIAYLKLSRFGDQTTSEWNQAVTEVVASLRTTPKPKGVVLDLRNNSGGYFQGAITISSEFLRNGVVVAQENSDGSKETFQVNRKGMLIDIPMAVLINKGSASAAEIVAGALKDHKRGKLIGETSFGKGSVQSPEELEGGSGVHITTARWILPNGDWIHGKGITPDVEVKTGTDSADLQLERAIEELTK